MLNTKNNNIDNNILIPQNNIPTLTAVMRDIPVKCEKRGIAVYYSQIANYQAKKDYGFGLDDELARQAAANLNWEIDTEIVDTLAANAKLDDTLVFSKTPLVGVSLQEHYASFVAKIEAAKQKIYRKTKKYAPTYIVVAPELMEIITMIPGFTPAPTEEINGPYFAGTVSGLKVFVSPSLEENTFFVGVNKNDLKASAIAYCPYMPIVPTQALNGPDGSISQGFMTVYALVMLNSELLISGRVTA